MSIARIRTIGKGLSLAALCLASFVACQSQQAPEPGLGSPKLPGSDPLITPSTEPTTKSEAPKAEVPEKPKPLYKNEALLKELTPANSRIEINLSERRALVYKGDELVIDTPISPGKKSHPTPSGSFTILEKEKVHHSNLYGKVLNDRGRVVTSDASSKKTKVPKGGKFLGASMPYFMRLTNDGVGLHQGYVPDYAASHGCIRLPSSVAALIYSKTKVGTPVVIQE